ncbi:TAXI family TRAP transporter solute-binding subunit [Streptomyces zingiberis]|uniref:TAXI family TRAP transporter solute-binding subunit n=1 Tax=Streptomyces zingiberis TaxID=2053010 RepID=A0ABX1BW43_9ACTN|nr:TAXI family TRAP transporter solute-binding subunit [Streptomyces zingiberis]NJQ01936.1 TAXI family TRAP transporter solute-binding subunit [Streptomyces zingiberis]
MTPALSRIGKRRAAQATLAVCAGLALLAWWLLPLRDTPAARGTVSFSTGVPTGVYWRYGDLLKERLADDLPEVDVRLETSEGSVQNLQRLVSGQANFTIATADAVAAYREANPRGARQLRACARLYDDYLQLVVPEDSEVTRAADLKGKRVAIGQPGSGVSLITHRLLRAAGLDPEEDITAVRVGIDRMPEMLREGRIDAFFWSGGLPTGAVADLAGEEPVRLVQLGDLLGELHRQGPDMWQYRAALVPADAYPEVRRGRAVKTVAVANLLVTTVGTDPGLTEGITRTVIDNRDRIGQEVHAAQLVDLRTAIFTDPLDLHRGAKRYYRSVKS